MIIIFLLSMHYFIFLIEFEIVYMLYLNDLENGGTEWCLQNVKLEAVKGTLVLWPSDFTHVHRGIVANEEKYICTGWLEHCL